MKKNYFILVAIIAIIFSCKKDPVNHLPEANNDSGGTKVNTVLNGEAQVNDTPSEDGGNAWSLVGDDGGAENGTVSMDATGNYTYSPVLNWFGTDVFTYQLCDTDGDCVEATVTIIVDPKIITLEGFNNIKISSLTVDGTNKLWVASDSGLYAEIPAGFILVSLETNKPVTALAYESGNNTIWAGTEAGIYKVKLGETDTTGENISPDLVSNNHILDACIDANSIRWFGTKTGITRNEGSNWQKENFKQNLSGTVGNLAFSTEAVTSIGVWDGDYFFATAGLKLWRTNDWDESIDAFTSATRWDPPYNGLAITDTMYAVFIDSNGYQWFGGLEGVQVHAGHDPKTNNLSFKAELVNENVRCVAEAPNGNIWCGTENGISIGTPSVNGYDWSASTASLSNNFVTAITFRGNTAWVGTKKGLNKIDL